MLRVGEGFNLARVNQASLIDEPAPPTESRARHERARAMSPWAMGGKRWEEPESRDRMGTWVPPVPLPAARCSQGHVGGRVGCDVYYRL